MFFHRSLSDSKSPQISWTLLSILADLNNAVVWTVSTRSFISKPLVSLVTVTSVPIIVVINVTHVPQFFQFPSKVDIFILLFTFF